MNVRHVFIEWEIIWFYNPVCLWLMVFLVLSELGFDIFSSCIGFFFLSFIWRTLFFMKRGPHIYKTAIVLLTIVFNDGLRQGIMVDIWSIKVDQILIRQHRYSWLYIYCFLITLSSLSIFVRFIPFIINTFFQSVRMLLLN